MLSTKTLASIAGLLKIKPDDLKKAIEDQKEADVEGFDEAKLQSFTTDELTTRDTNVVAAKKPEIEKAAKEILIKDLKTQAGLEFEGKDPAKFVTEFKNKIVKDSKIEPNAKVQELETQISVLKTSIATHEDNVKLAKAEAETAKLDSRILASLPENRNKSLSDSDYLLLIKNRMKIENVDNQELVKNDKGEVFRDTKAAPMVLKDAIAEVFTKTTGWTAEPEKGGRGGGSSNPGAGGSAGTPTSYSEAVKQWTDQGKSMNSPELATWVGKLQTDNKSFVMDLDKAVGESAPSGSDSK
jgi:hypothetical protein